ncbi:UvrD-helicase domain-containing protein [Ureibacillus acetophenoni]|uniref:DNA 3'-5' helicase n=1 Tax=Ureibacillus acetophenoni TaxID=614649 RepID=A0A285UMU0_9BACL|nr:UvrD-helicase domain-containing protein [Ureibacillus acetophenoni]SOC43093.1 ATP-dependent exoDNAse (exonuclease V) beta subunit [Ureibacillus acetophenoni]
MSGNLKIISAGAGAGKTTRLSKEIIDVIQNDIAPEKIVATTFTKKAAEELIERIRLELLKSGKTEEASRILDGYVGTMNSVFGRIIKEFALDIGLSPIQNLLEENESMSLFNSIAYQAIQKYELQNYESLQRLQLIDKDNSWNKYVLDVLKLARENGLSTNDVKACAKYSWDAMQEWLPEPTCNSEEQTKNLIVALKNASKTLPGNDKTKTTQKVVDEILTMLSQIERNGYLSWDQWAKASKLKPAKASLNEVAPLHNAASIHPSHPQLHSDLKEVIEAVFYCAAEAMELYEQEKNLRGLIDFTDQEYLALRLLEDDDYIHALKERIEAVFVDEFQDSSPLQIALNMKLREIAKSATWVGDVKQAIYGFRGTDPDLMKIAMNCIQGIEQDILGDSYRSRQSLVEFVNELFVPVFEVTGLTKELVALNPKREDLKEQQLALESWTFSESKNVKDDAASLAHGVCQIIQQKESYIVVDKETREQRTLKPNDIAILCRSNDECTVIANALSKLGISATIGGSGLMATVEVIYALATLRYLIDERDTLALAQILHFSSEEWQNGEWLEAWLNVENPKEIVKDNPIITQLDKVRTKIFEMSPSEILDLAIVTAKVDEQLLRWGNGNQRLANIDNLRALVQQYEHGAESNGYAATASGLLFYLKEIENDKERNRVAESNNENAVKILTYHRAKGLEWPFVILYSLNKSAISSSKPSVFDRVLAVSTESFNVEKPLQGRKLFFWPWPYGGQSKDVGFDSLVQQTFQLNLRNKQLLEESQRLLYVGMTRARDYLVLATRDFSKATWLNELTNRDGQQIISSIYKTEDDLGEIIVNGRVFSMKHRSLSVPDEIQVTNDNLEQTIYIGESIEKTNFLPATFRPSMTTFAEHLEENILKEEINVKIESIGTRLPITGSPEMDILGSLVHSFLAADHSVLNEEKRHQLAQTILQNFNVFALTPEALVEASNRLNDFIEANYPSRVGIYKEFPIHLKIGKQKASGFIDCLIELPEGWVIIDHKTFPGSEELWTSRAYSHLPQLQIYTQALIEVSNKPVLEAWIHMPVVGKMVQFKNSDLQINSNQQLLLF